MSSPGGIGEDRPLTGRAVVLRIQVPWSNERPAINIQLSTSFVYMSYSKLEGLLLILMGTTKLTCKSFLVRRSSVAVVCVTLSARTLMHLQKCQQAIKIIRNDHTLASDTVASDMQ